MKCSVSYNSVGSQCESFSIQHSISQCKYFATLNSKILQVYSVALTGVVAVRGDPSLLVEGLGDVVPGIVKWRKEVQETYISIDSERCRTWGRGRGIPGLVRVRATHIAHTTHHSAHRTHYT